MVTALKKRKWKDLAGKRFERWTVIGPREWRVSLSYWKCKCDCGKIKFIATNELTAKRSRSCGCLAREISRYNALKHGQSATPEYNRWRTMINRCYDPKNENYPHYGARGITVCWRWRRSLSAFISDIGRCPGPGYSLERVNNNKGYYPSNCRWATVEEQAVNRRSSNIWVVMGREYGSSAQAARAEGLTQSQISRWCRGYKGRPPRPGHSVKRKYAE